MGNVGKVILTVQGSYALADAQATGKNIQPEYYKVSNQDIPLDPTLTDLPGVWKQDNISGYIPVDPDTVEFVIDIPHEEAKSWGKTFGLYLSDGTLFAIAKPPYPFPPNLRQTFRIQVRYSNINQITDFKYIPFYETEQSLMTLQTAAVLGDEILSLSKTLSLLEGDYRQLKAKVNRLLNQHSERLSEQEKLTFELQLLLLQAISTLGDAINNLAKDISALKAQIFKEV